MGLCRSSDSREALRPKRKSPILLALVAVLGVSGRSRALDSERGMVCHGAILKVSSSISVVELLAREPLDDKPSGGCVDNDSRSIDGYSVETRSSGTLTPHRAAIAKRRRTREKTCPASLTIFSTCISRSSSSSSSPEADFAWLTIAARSDKTRLRSRARGVNCRSKCASRDKHPMAARIERTQDMMHATEGWKWAIRFERTALCSNDKAWSNGTIGGGQ